MTTDFIKETISLYINERSSFVIDDARSYIYLRARDLLQKEGLGGGNFATAYAQFAYLNLLSKIQYYLDHPERFISIEKADQIHSIKSEVLASLSGESKKITQRFFRLPRVMDTNEKEAFAHLFHLVENCGVTLHTKRNNDDAEVIWHGFRNALAHLATVQQGKGIETFSFEEYWEWQNNSGTPLNSSELLARVRRLKNRPVFRYRDISNGWVLNVDALSARLDEITKIVLDNVKRSKYSADKLNAIITLIQPE